MNHPIPHPMSSVFPGLAAVAFDLDDTLFDREAALRRWLEAWIGKLTPGDWEEILRQDGRGHLPRPRFFEWLTQRWPVAGCDGHGLWSRFRAEFPDCLHGDPAAGPLLKQLNESGLMCGMLTNGSTVLQSAKLQAIGLIDHFIPGHILISEAIGAEKPALSAFAAMCEALALPADRILFVGDHAEKDIAGAKAAGMRTCWLRRRDPGGICPQADLVIDSLEELMPLLFSRA
jgi:putative hydrolase of the HAD superfamily